MASSRDTVDVVVVGAGLSGLTAAYTVLKKKPMSRVLVLEAADQIGGDVSSETLKTPSGTNEFDMCGTQIGSMQKEILGLLRELGMDTVRQYNKGNKFWRLPDGKLKKFSGAIPPLPYATLLDVVRYFKKVDGMQGQIKMDRVHECKHAEEWDAMTVEEFLKKYLWTQAGRVTIESMCLSFCYASPAELTMMQYLYLIHTCGGWDAHINSGDKGRTDLLIKDGVMALCQKLGEIIKSENIVLGDAVRGIIESGEMLRVDTASGKEYQAKQVIMAVPCGLSGKVNYSPPLRTDRSKSFPKKTDQLLSVLTYKSAFWREAGHTGEYLNLAAFTRDTLANVDQTIVISMDAVLPGGQPALKIFSNPDRLRGKSEEGRKDMLIHLLSDVFGPQIRDCLDYAEKEWHFEADGDKSPVSHSSELLASVNKPHGRVHWAGSDAGTVWSGTLNGAVQSGQRAAEEVIAAI